MIYSKLTYYSFFIIFLFACKDNSLESPPSVALNGKVTNHAVDVLLSKALSANGNYEFNSNNNSFFVNDAKVFLYENDVKLFTLSFINKGLYRFQDSTWEAKIDKNYKIIANIPNHGIIESENVIFPEPITITNFTYTTQQHINNNNPDTFLQANIIALIKPQLKQSNHYYQMEYNGERADGIKLYAPFPLYELNTMLDEKKGTECGRLYDYSDVFFTRECLQNNKFYDIIRLDGSNITIPNFVNTEAISKMKIKFHAISESFHRHLQNRNNQQNIDERFQEIPPSYSNIKNGIGIFYAKNEGKNIYLLKP